MYKYDSYENTIGLYKIAQLQTICKSLVISSIIYFNLE